MTLPPSPSASPAHRAARAAGLLALALLVLVPATRAQPLRVTSWNVVPPAHTNALTIPAVADALKRLAPDIILLQQVADKETCEALADALKPSAYQVVICSAFREARSGILRRHQVAILARAEAKPYYSWSEPWHNRDGPALPGGFAFAALEVGNRRVGLFSIQAGSLPARAIGKKKAAASLEARQTATIEQLLAKVGSVSNWVADQVQVFVVGGAFELAAAGTMALEEGPMRRLQDAGFGDAFREQTAAERATLWARPGQVGPTTDYIFAQPADCTANPAVFHVAAAKHYPISCDVRPAPPTTAAAPATRPEPAPVPVVPTPDSGSLAAPTAQPSVLSPTLLQLGAALAMILVLLLSVWFLARRSRSAPRPRPVLLTSGGEAPPGYTVVMTSASATESAASNRRTAPPPRPLIHVETPGDTQTQSEDLRQRALDAEQRADQATAVIRAGLLPQLNHWLKQTLTRKLMTDRAHLMKTQHVAALKALAVEQRLSRIEQQLQQQNQTYQQRIDELTHLLAVAKEENRELIRVRITQVKAEMAAARARLLAQAGSD